MARLAVLIPHRDRKEFKEFQISYLPNFIKSQGIDCKIFFCEQKDAQIFNRSKSLNFAFKFCMEEYNPDYVVSSDIDMVPFKVDYHWRGIAEAWFMNAGGIKVLASDFLKVNGYNNDFFGWGYEDSEFWLRLDCFGVKNERWRAPPETELVDLEMRTTDSEAFSLSYFGSNNPRFFHYGEKQETKHIHYKPQKTWYNEHNKKKNDNLIRSIREMQKEERLSYFGCHGLNEIDLERVEIESNGREFAEIAYKA